MTRTIALLLLPMAGLLSAFVPDSTVFQATADPFRTSVVGQVLDREERGAIPDARVRIPALGLETYTDERGRFAWGEIPIPAEAHPVEIEVRASGFGDWSLAGVRLLADDTLIVNAALGSEPQRITLPPAEGVPFEPEQPETGIEALADDLSGETLPDTIRVRVSGYPYTCNPNRSYTVETVHFSDYVRHVLPNEWHKDYSESLRAGAMAVKTYAWYWIARGGKWSDADVWDSTCDQVYNPAFEYASTNAAVNHTWNWRLTEDEQLFQTSYRTYAYQCGDRVNCLGQIEADQMAANGATWDEILLHFYGNSALGPVVTPGLGGSALRFHGNGYGLYDRVLIRVDDPGSVGPGPPVDVGAEDFTLELWLRTLPGENLAAAVACGPTPDWRAGNALLDRSRSQGMREFGVALAGGRVVVGVTGQDAGPGPEHLTLCGQRVVDDGHWHHVAVQRRAGDGQVWLFVDGAPDAHGVGPPGDISYPDDGLAGLGSDPFLVVGAGKGDSLPELHPSFHGWIDELRVSRGLRYTTPFIPPGLPFSIDVDTIALYPFDEGVGNQVNDLTAPGGPNTGERRYGGAINGPEWTASEVYLNSWEWMPLVVR